MDFCSTKENDLYSICGHSPSDIRIFALRFEHPPKDIVEYIDRNRERPDRTDRMRIYNLCLRCLHMK